MKNYMYSTKLLLRTHTSYPQIEEDMSFTSKTKINVLAIMEKNYDDYD